MTITHKRLKELLEYNPKTGRFTWKVSRRNGIKIGDLAGGKTVTGYEAIKIDFTFYLSHRLAYFYMTKKWPRNEIDHIDTVRSNNVWSNLRSATRGQNNCNRGKTKKNSSGVKGVHWNKVTKKYIAQIQYNKKKIHLGCFISIFEAEQVVKQKRMDLHKEFTRN
jgi:hypothetical protein